MKLLNLSRKSLVLTASLIGALLLANNSSAQINIQNQNKIAPAVACSNGQVITYNTTTGAWDTCAANGGASGISGSIASTQVAVGTGVNTIGGDSDFTWVDPTLNFTISKGLSFAGGGSPIILKGGDDGFGSTNILITNSGNYVPISVTGNLEFLASGGILLGNTAVTSYIDIDGAIAAANTILFVSPNYQFEGGTVTVNGLSDSNYIANNSQTVGALGSDGTYLNVIRTIGAAADLYYAQGVLLDFGTGGVAAKGAAIPHGVFTRIEGSGDAGNEFETEGSWLLAKLGTGYTQSAGPTGLFTYKDMGMDGPIELQPVTYEGVRYIVNNFYNGSPATGLGFGYAALTKRGASPGSDATHNAANTYKMGVGFYVGGTSTSSANSVGWEIGFQVGGDVAATTGATNAINTAFKARDIYTTLIDVAAAEGTNGNFLIASDDGDDATDTWTFSVAATGNSLSLSNNSNNYFVVSTAGAITGPTNFTSALYSTTTNCSDSAGDAACGSAAAGTVVVDATDTTTVVSTTAVTAASEIFLQVDSSLGARLGVTCNTQDPGTFDARITARTAATSFTITLDAGPTTNPLCLSYKIVN